MRVNFSMVFVSCLERLSWCQDEFFMFSRFPPVLKLHLNPDCNCVALVISLSSPCPLTTAPKQEREELLLGGVVGELEQDDSVSELRRDLG